MKVHVGEVQGGGWDDAHLSVQHTLIEAETSEGPVKVHIHQGAPGEDLLVYIFTGPDRDGTGMKVLMDLVHVDFEAV